jgi:hypothetical protein
MDRRVWHRCGIRSRKIALTKLPLWGKAAGRLDPAPSQRWKWKGWIPWSCLSMAVVAALAAAEAGRLQPGQLVRPDSGWNSTHAGGRPGRQSRRVWSQLSAGSSSDA